MTESLVPLAMCLIDQFIDHWRIIVENLIMVANKRKAFKHLKVSRWFCWCLYYCSVFMLKFGQALGKDIESEFLSRIQSLSLVKILSLKFGQDIEGDTRPGSWSWHLEEVLKLKFGWLVGWTLVYICQLTLVVKINHLFENQLTPLTFSRNPNPPITVTGVWRNSLDPCWLLPVFARPQFPDCNHIVGRQLQKEKTGICLNALFVSKKLLKYKIQKVSWIVWFMYVSMYVWLN